MIKMEFAAGFEQLFEKHGLRTFDDFFQYSSGEVINQNKKRSVLTFTLDDDGGQRRFFVKRFDCPHFKDMLFTFSNFGYICSQARCEWNNANLLLENGIDTYHPACYGEELVCGIEKRSIFVTEEIKGVCLTDFIGEKWANLERVEKERIAISIGKTARKIHDAKISMPDMYVWHFFIKDERGESGDYEFAVIDLHRMSVNVSSKNLQYKNLGALDYSLLPEYFDIDLKDLLLNAYMGGDLPENAASLKSKVKARSDVLAARRRKPKY